MIYSLPLTRRQRRKSQKNYCIFAALNGISYMCLGETIIVLFAIKLNAPNGMVAALGAMIYFAFFMLPVGKLVAARVGAARSQAVVWTLRNIVAVGVALSAVTEYYGFHNLALFQVLLGACLFYGMRAAGVVMGQPLIGNISSSAERSRVLGVSNALFYAGCMAALSLIWFILSQMESIWVIMAIIIFGACVGVFSTRYIRRIDESSALIEAARRSIMPEIREAWKIPRIRKLIFAMYTAYMAVIMLGASSMLCIKRGYGVSDTAALYFSLMQFLAAALFSWTSAKIIRKHGSKFAIVWSFYILLTVAGLWIFAPMQLDYWHATVIFLIIGGAFVVCSNAMTTYSLHVAPERLWVAASMLTSVVTSVGAGVSGILVTSTLFKYIDKIGVQWVPVNRFKVYFSIALVILLLMSVVVWKLPDDAEKEAKNT